MKTIRFSFTLLVFLTVLVFPRCGDGTITEGDPTGQGMTDSTDTYRNDAARPKRHPRSADTVDVKPMP